MKLAETKKALDNAVEILKADKAVLAMLTDNGVADPSRQDYLYMAVLCRKVEFNNNVEHPTTQEERNLFWLELNSAVNKLNLYYRYIRTAELADMSWADAIRSYFDNQAYRLYRVIVDPEMGGKAQISKNDTGASISFRELFQVCQPNRFGCVNGAMAIYLYNLQCNFILGDKDMTDPNRKHEAAVETFIMLDHVRDDLKAMRLDIGWNPGKDGIITNRMATDQLNDLVNRFLLKDTGITLEMNRADMKYVRNGLYTNGDRANSSGTFRKASVATMWKYIFRAMYTRKEKDGYKVLSTKEKDVDMSYLRAALHPVVPVEEPTPAPKKATRKKTTTKKKAPVETPAPEQVVENPEQPTEQK